MKKMIISIVIGVMALIVGFEAGMLAKYKEEYDATKFEAELIQKFESERGDVYDCEFIDKENYTIYYKDSYNDSYRIYEHSNDGIKDGPDNRTGINRMVTTTLHRR